MRAPEPLPVGFGGLFRAPVGLAIEKLPSATGEEVVLSFPLETEPCRHPPLTPAEDEILADLLLGHTNLQISRRRGVALRTIANQVGTLFRKLGVHSRLEAARVAAVRMSRKMPRDVYTSAHTDSSIAQVSEPSDSPRKMVTHFRPVDPMR